MPFSPDDFRRFLIANDRNPNCCGEPEYSVLASSDPAVAATFKLEPTQGTGWFEFAAAACASCGNVQVYLADIIERWASQNPPSGGDKTSE